MRYAGPEKQVQEFCFMGEAAVNQFGRQKSQMTGFWIEAEEEAYVRRKICEPEW